MRAAFEQISEEHIVKYQMVEKQLRTLTAKPAYQFDKKTVAGLATLTAEQISMFNQEEATSCLESFNNLKNVSTRILELFKLSEANPSHQRALEIMENLANGTAMRQMNEIRETAHKLGFFGVVDDSKLPEMRQIIKWAILYKVVEQYKTQIENNTNLLYNRVLESLSENAHHSTCTQQ